MASIGLDDLAARPLVVEGVPFLLAPLGGTRTSALVVVKPESAVEGYRALLRGHDHPRLVELGIAYGGSAALFALLAHPAHMVAVELSTERSVPLDRFIAERGLEASLHCFYGVDQADVGRLTAVLDDEFGDEPLDLVVDDASHRYPETLASFQVLFPRLRPGGEYIIEDWRCDHELRAALAGAMDDPASPWRAWAEDLLAGGGESGHDGQPSAAAPALAALRVVGDRSEPPLSHLVLRLLLGAADPGTGIERVDCGPFSTRVVRSEAPLPIDGFDLAVACADHFGSLAPFSPPA